MYNVNLAGKRADKVEAVTFTSLNLQEADIEKILRNNIDMLCDDEESMLIVGRQVCNARYGRSDLTAVDNEGSIVLIEIKRDLSDIKSRREPFEFQAIRYAASYATIEGPGQLVETVFVPYLEKHRDEFEIGELTFAEYGSRELRRFLRENEAERDFNAKQRVILVAAEFDDQTLSAVAWLNSNGVDISCYKLVPYKIGEDLYWNVVKLLPPTTHEDFYVNLLQSTAPGVKAQRRTKRVLPKIGTMLEWGVVKPGDIITAKGRPDEAILLANGNVDVEGEELSLQAWLKRVFGWASVETYAFSVDKKTGKTLASIRAEYMEKEQGD